MSNNPIITYINCKFKNKHTFIPIRETLEISKNKHKFYHNSLNPGLDLEKITEFFQKSHISHACKYCGKYKTI